MISVTLIIPCHRLIGSNGSLTGYGGGIDKKRWLLEYEKRRIKVKETHSRNLMAMSF
jgi:AraC family transcriptional regulator of adaptative response/methylated-DNA-[protein]-cysteine methyltransferase